MHSSIRDATLTRLQLEALLRRLDPDRDCAGQKYEDIRRKLIRFFRWNGCCLEEDLADATFDRVAQKLASVEVRDVAAFVWGVARNVALEAGKRRPPSALDALPRGKEPHTGHAEGCIIAEREKQRRLQCLQACVDGLAAVDRDLLLQYESCAGEGLRPHALAERLGLTIGALRTRAHRLRHRIEACSLRCLRSRPGRGAEPGGRRR